MFKTLIFLLPFFLLVSHQEHYVLSFRPEFIVEGTSNVKSWEIRSSKAEGKAIIKVENEKITGIHELGLKIPVHSLKSGNPQMDRNTYKAMKATEFHDITFRLTKMLNSSNYGNKQIIRTEGDLTIAGVTRKVQLEAESGALEGRISFNGSITLKMSDFNIEPPAALMGTLKTGDEITVSFKVQFSISNNKIK